MELKLNEENFINEFRDKYISKYFPSLEFFSSEKYTDEFEVTVKINMLNSSKYLKTDHSRLVELFADKFKEEYIKTTYSFTKKEEIKQNELEQKYLEFKQSHHPQQISTISKKPLNTNDHWVQEYLPETEVMFLDSFFGVVHIDEIELTQKNNFLIATANFQLNKNIYVEFDVAKVYVLLNNKNKQK